jgi:hypothetical protein
MRTVDEWSEIAESAYDDFKEARRVFANAKADYEHKRLTVKAQSDAASQAARDSEAEVAARVEKVALIRAESVLDITETYLKLAQNEMVAAMSVRKYMGNQDGGTDWGTF